MTLFRMCASSELMQLCSRIQLLRAKQPSCAAITISQSTPWPDQWLEECLSLYELNSKEELLEHPLIQEILQHVRDISRESLADLKKLQEFIDETPSIANYAEAVESDCERMKRLSEAESISDIRSITAERSKAFKSISGDFEEKDIAKDMRQKVKDRISALAKKFFAEDEDRTVEITQGFIAKSDIPEIVKLRKKYTAHINKIIKDNKAEQMKYLKEYTKILKQNGVASSDAIINLTKEKTEELKDISRENREIQQIRDYKFTDHKVFGPYMKKYLGISDKTYKKRYDRYYEGIIAKLYRVTKNLSSEEKELLNKLINDKSDVENVARNMANLLWEIQNNMEEYYYRRK